MSKKEASQRRFANDGSEQLDSERSGSEQLELVEKGNLNEFYFEEK